MDTHTKRKCPICKKQAENLEQHLQAHIKASFRKETLAFHETQGAVAAYKRIFNKEP